MIPTMLVFGLVFGRWWKSALVAAAIVWPALLVFNGTFEKVPQGQSVWGNIVLASGLSVANAAVGVGAHQLVLYIIRKLRPTVESPKKQEVE